MDTRDDLWHALTVKETARRQGTALDSGLSDEEARRRLERSGPNRLREDKLEPIWEAFLDELREPMILLLVVTGVFYALWGELTDALTIFAVIFTLVAAEVLNERRAGNAVAALRKLAEPAATVRRNGRTADIPAEEIVPGDLLVLNAGHRVPADARLVESFGLAVNESSLTGESVPVDKDAGAVLAENSALAERRNMVFSGTAVTRGRATAVVVGTGTASEIGRLADLAAEVEPPRTLLQKSMSELSGKLVWLALGSSVAVPLLGWLLSHQPLRQMLLTGLSLAFAVIPEELPIIITMVLALGAYRLSKQKAIVKDLQSVETLGAITVIATDKTGTLTENRMRVSQLYPEAMASRVLQVGVLCNDAADGQAQSDPLEVALWQAAKEAHLDVVDRQSRSALRDEFTFDNERKLMSVVYGRDGGLWVGVKGAPEAVLHQSTRLALDGELRPLGEADRKRITDETLRMAEQGLRVIAMAEKTAPEGRLSQMQAESELTFLGLVGLADPARPEVREAIQSCRSAGIRPIMITGDHPFTARKIAADVGMDGQGAILTGAELDTLSDEELTATVGQISLYARTTPEHKLRIVRALQRRGDRVAVTGDGINDAPALVAADIGVAMGETGTDVAREASDIVLADDNFSTIVRAVNEGRALFANLTKGVRYYLACKVALVLATLVPTLLRVPVPFAPVQIILMELFMDLAASAAFVAEPPESDLMRQKPRDPQAAFIDKAMMGSILTSAVGLFAAVTAVYLYVWYRGAGLQTAQTAAFVTWLLGHVLLALNMRSERQPIFQLGLFSNLVLDVWGLAAIAFVLAATFVTPLHAALKTTSLSGAQWVQLLVAVVVGTFWMEVRKLMTFKRG